jgi:hypothetical protein
MTIKIISTYTPATEYNLGHFSIDLTRKTAVLIRQSMKKADTDHYESRMMQENLVPIAIKVRGDVDDRNILLFDEGAGVSGTKGYDQREKLSALYLAIANDIVGSLFVARPDRLFRDKHFTNVSMFTELAERKKLILVVPGRRVYDFTKYTDLQAFQKDMQDAYGYLANHVRYMNEARDQKMLRGKWGGNALPAPYIINRSAWKDDQVPIIYQPWLEPSIDLFKRFKGYDFSLARICRYIECVPYLFKLPPLEDTQRYLFKTNMRLATGGYTLSSFSSVRAYLSNLTLGGYAKVGEDEEGNELLVPHAFDAAISYELLDEVYAAITGHHIDGTPFEGQKDTRRYMRSNPQGSGVLFPSSILTSDQGHVSTDVKDEKGTYICFQRLEQEGYTLKTKLGIMSYKMLWSLPGRELDKIITYRLFELAEQDKDMAERVKAIFDSMKGQGEDEAKLLERQIEKTRKQIERLDFLLKNPEVELDVETAKEYAKDLSELRPMLARLLKKQDEKPDLDPEATIKNFYFVLSHITTEFFKQSAEVQRKMMSKLVKEVIVNNLSPHLFYLYIVWQEGVATRPDVALLWRGQPMPDREAWSDEDNALIRSHWPKGRQEEILRFFPLSTWTSIRHQANILGLHRSKELKSGRKKVNPFHETITYKDLLTAMQFAQAEDREDDQDLLFYGNSEEAIQYDEEESKIYICEIIQELAETTARGKISAYWPWPVEVVGFSSLTMDEAISSGGRECPPGASLRQHSLIAVTKPPSPTL